MSLSDANLYDPIASCAASYVPYGSHLYSPQQTDYRDVAEPSSVRRSAMESSLGSSMQPDQGRFVGQAYGSQSGSDPHYGLDRIRNEVQTTITRLEALNTRSPAPTPRAPRTAASRNMSLCCTHPGCAKVFSSPSEWKRHEAEHHRPWICMADRTHIIDGHCAICGQEDTTSAHKYTHDNVENCIQKPVHKRSFRDLDRITQHITNHHQGRSPPTETLLATRKQLLSRWKAPAELSTSALWCGFCQSFCSTWSSRQEHVLQHLQNGYMKDGWTEQP